MKFSSLGLPTPIAQGARAAGYLEPTSIQNKAIPVILQGNDLIGNAPSGSGKTGAFLMPALSRMLDGPQKLRMLVLTPTREHAVQVDEAAHDLARLTELRIGIAHNAAPIAAQERVLRDPGCDILIATVDRVLELHAKGSLAFDDIEIFVLDEADRMVDLGQATDVRRLLKLLPETRQTLLFSATMPAELNRLAKEALIEPVRVDLTAPQPTTGITHAIYPVPRHLKIELLDRMLSRSGEVRGTIIFTRQREGADRLARQLERRRYSVRALHEAPGQTDRERALEDLKRDRLQIVVATDQAARGIDLASVTHIVNFDVPPTPEDYVQRIGRAGRPDAPAATGDAFTLMAPEEQRHLAAIERYVGRAIPRVLLPDFDYGMKPSQIQQHAVYEDEKARARRAALAKSNPYLAARTMPPLPGTRGAARLAARALASKNSSSKGALSSGSRPKLANAPGAKPRIGGLKPTVMAKLKPVEKPRPAKTVASRLPVKSLAKSITRIVVRPLTKLVVRPITKPTVRPITKPIVRPITKPTVRPITKPTARPITKPVARPAAKPVARPPARPARPRPKK